MIYCYILFVLCFNCFSLIGYGLGANSINISDFGLLFLFALLIKTLFISIDTFKITKGSFLVYTYVVMYGISILCANYYYKQSFFDGFAAVRGQLYILSYFVFIKYLDEHRFKFYLNLIGFTMFVVGLLSILNHFGLSIFYKDRYIYRLDVERLFVPGFEACSFIVLWYFARIRFEKRDYFFMSSMFLLHLMRMTRSRLIVVSVFLCKLLLTNKSYKSFFAIFILGIIFLYSIDVVYFQSFQTAFKEIQHNDGTWGTRIDQIRFAINAFLDSPIFGSGIASLRNSIYSNNNYLFSLSYQADLGYFSWLKGFGVIGQIWLVFFIYFQLRYKDFNILEYFAKDYVYFIILSFITINHLMYPTGIFLVTCIMSVRYIEKSSE